MSGRAIAGGLELSCIFAEGSQAQSCILSIYRIPEIGTDRFIVNVSISRGDSRSSGQVVNLELGEYVIREVAEIESDGQVTVHNRRDILTLMVNESAPATTSESTTQIPGYLYYLCMIVITSTYRLVSQELHQVVESQSLLHRILGQ